MPSNKSRTSSGDDPHRNLSSAVGRKLLKRMANRRDFELLLPYGAKILVGFSGGPDSTALLRVLIALCDRFGFRIAAAHVNYRLRGEDSEKDERFVARFCKRYGIPLYTFHPKNAVGKNEEWLRDVRYRFFERTRKRTGFDRIATAHTKDDQAETVLLRLLRGAGADGLSGIRPMNGHIIRPLLHIRKDDLVSFLKEERIAFRVDRTNGDTSIIRNRIRHKLLPLLERDYQQNIRNILARTADTFSGHTRSEQPRLPIAVPNGIGFSRSDFLSLTDSARSDELRYLYRLVSGTHLAPSAAFIREAKKVIESEKGKVRKFESGQLKIEARGDKVVMIRNNKS